MLPVWRLDPRHSGCFARLETLLNNLRGFHALIVQHNNPAYRDGLIQRLQTLQPVGGAVLDLQALFDFEAFEMELADLSGKVSVVHLINLESWDENRRQAFFRGINYHREYLARQLNATLALWLVEPHIRDLALQAPDFWAWREQSLDFSFPLEPQTRWAATIGNTTNLDQAAKRQRIQELLDFLATRQDGEPTLTRADMRYELGYLYEELGEYGSAQQQLGLALDDFTRLDERHACARVMRDQATIRFRQGEPAEALADLRTRVLPSFVKLEDLGQQAATQGRIADILQARGQLDEALAIRQSEQLPVFEKLGDVREKAVTMGQIADILQARGQLDEALAIRQSEQLPVFEKLGDVRSKAVTMGQIADILQARGQLDEALAIRQSEELPVFEKLGDVREKAVTMGKIGDILQARGQLDEALAIRQSEQLPVFEKLGDVREKAVTMGKIADILYKKDAVAYAETVCSYLCQALRAFQMMQMPRETKWVQDRLKNAGFSCEEKK